ncbi:MAG: chemotaxis response regulator protein-glutamate methylesterase [Ruminiclostridium sp.]|nr:chemotaxis response regulator protein-glutamate methylesterase [Ruminiclostridium sp.]
MAIRVLTVDDSILFRTVIKTEFAKIDDIDIIDTAANAIEAEEKIMRLNPDVVTMDVEMPGMNGIDFIKSFLPKKRVPFIVITSSPTRAFDAISVGAVEFMKKPLVHNSSEMTEFCERLASIIRFSAKAKVRQAPTRPISTRPVQSIAMPAGRGSSNSVIALGASTGGTDALIEVVKRLPANSPPVVIVQHMPAGFTQMYAERLDKICAMSCKEAADGDRLRPGLIIVGAGSYHLRLQKDARGYYITSKPGAKVSGHCPSVDVLFESVAEAAGPYAVGAILTGMGADGAEGLLKMRKAGAYTIGQDEASCVVYGMPGVAFKIGAVMKQLPLDKIAEEIISKVR